MATAGTINIAMQAGTQQLKAGLDTGMGFVTNFASHATAALSSGFNTLQDWVGEVGDTVDPIGKLADRLGIATEELMGLEHAAGLSGTETGTLRKGLERMSKRLGDVARGAVEVGEAIHDADGELGELSLGSSPAAKALETLGLTFDAIADKDAVGQFKTLGQAISELDDPMTKLSVTQNLFGASGRGMLNMLEAGEEGIEAMIQEAKDLGITLNTQDITGIENMNDALSKVDSAFTSIKQNVVAALAPSIGYVADLFTEWTTGALDGGNRVRDLMSGIGEAGLFVVDMLAYLEPIGRLTFANITSMASGLLSGLASVGEGIESLLNMIPGMDVEFTGGLRSMADAVADFSQGAFDAASDSMAIWHDPSLLPSERIREFFAGVEDSAGDAKQSVFEAGEAVDSIGEEIEQAKTGFASAIDFGSAEALSAINRHNFEGSGKEEGVRVAKDQLTVQHRMASSLNTIASALPSLISEPVDIV